MSESNEVYDKLSDEFGTKFDSEDGSDITNTISQYEESKNELVKKVSSNEKSDFSLEDKEYISFELKCLISGGVKILETLTDDIKVGVKPSYYDAYFNGVNSLREIMKELRELNKAVVDAKSIEYKMDGRAEGKGNLTVNNFNLTGKELLMKLSDAQKGSSLNEIKAEFKIDDEKI